MAEFVELRVLLWPAGCGFGHCPHSQFKVMQAVWFSFAIAVAVVDKLPTSIICVPRICPKERQQLSKTFARLHVWPIF